RDARRTAPLLARRAGAGPGVAELPAHRGALRRGAAARGGDARSAARLLPRHAGAETGVAELPAHRGALGAHAARAVRDARAAAAGSGDAAPVAQLEARAA